MNTAQQKPNIVYIVFAATCTVHKNQLSEFSEDYCCNYWNSQYYLNTIEIAMNYLTDYLK